MSAPKSLRRRVLASWPVRRTVEAIERGHARGPGDLVVAMFHRTLDGTRFDAQLDALLDGRVAVRGSAVVDALTGGPALPAGAVWITFDDAYGDFAEHAWPVLRRRGLPATQFVPTHFLGARPATFWWERLASAFAASDRARVVVDGPLGGPSGGPLTLDLGGRGARARSLRTARSAIKALPHRDAMRGVEALIETLGAAPVDPSIRVLDEAEIARFVAEGLEVGGHTRSHPMLDRVSEAEALAEIRAGFDDLRERFGDVLPAFAYPSGQYDDGVVRAAAASGARVAVTTDPGVNVLSKSDPLRLRRVAIGPHADGTAVRLRVAFGL